MTRAILTDIEGTTSSIAFVHDILFPYAAEKLPAYIRAHADEDVVKTQLDAVRAEVNQPDFDTEGVIKVLLDWIAEDLKATPLKTLQGLVWEAGYANGDYHGHIYEDAVNALRHWQQADIDLYVYSSGSIKAQKLLFGHTAYGDLTPLFKDYFDTTTGGKREATSYQKIQADIGIPAHEILFLSDLDAELEAAHTAGMQVTCLRRDGALKADYPFPQVIDFSQIDVMT